jgi:futalosine hydrolase
MPILIAAATSIEIQSFLQYLQHPSFTSLNKEIDVLVTGIGLTACTYSLSKQLQLKKYTAVIQAGVAGCFNKKISLGTVVVVKKDTIADQSVIELNQLKSLFDLKLVPHSRFPYKNKWLTNPYLPLLKATGLKTVTGISVNEITAATKKVQFYTQHFNPVVESMEGAALHYVALMEGVPFLQLRSMSNYVAERNKSNWNMKESIANLNNTLIQLVEKV